MLFLSILKRKTVHSEIVYTCQEKIILSTRQWQLLSSVAFGIFATGMEMPDRPEHELVEKTLTVKFNTCAEFRDFVRRALAVRASRLIAFGIIEVTGKKITCGALFNQTEPLTIDESVIESLLLPTEC